VPEADGEKGSLRIGALSRRVGVSPPVLRAWESRYGLLQPDRSEGGFRLYSAADERAVRAMQRHMTRGLSTAQAAQAAIAERSGEAESEAEDSPGADTSAGTLTDALLRYDEAAAQAILDRAFALQPLESVLSGLVAETLRQIGDGWARGDVTVAQEHFASNIIRARLVALARGWEAGSGSAAVLACVPEELHDIGLVAFGLALWRRGWRVVYLGQTTPVADMREAVAGVDASVLVVHAHTAELLAGAEDELGGLASETRIALSGGGATPAAAARIGAEILEGSYVDAAEAVDQRWQAARPGS
jgi:DNA-binding transcriptional MerR regulator